MARCAGGMIARAASRRGRSACPCPTSSPCTRPCGYRARPCQSSSQQAQTARSCGGTSGNSQPRWRNSFSILNSKRRREQQKMYRVKFLFSLSLRNNFRHKVQHVWSTSQLSQPSLWWERSRLSNFNAMNATCSAKGIK